MVKPLFFLITMIHKSFAYLRKKRKYSVEMAWEVNTQNNMCNFNAESAFCLPISKGEPKYTCHNPNELHKTYISTHESQIFLSVTE